MPTSIPPKSAFGIKGLDEILLGGLPSNRFYLVQGDPGVGKTTLALQFLMEGARNGEKVLYITLSETKDELSAVAESHAWDLSGLNIIELSAVEDQIIAASQNTLFHAQEVELAQTADMLLEGVAALNPARVVFDSLSEIRLLAQDSLRYRRQMLSFKQYFAKRKCTVLLLDDKTSEAGDLHIQSIAHGVISLRKLHTQIGADRRQLSVVKLRGAKFLDGLHDYEIHSGGLAVYPRLIASDSPKEFREELISSGIPGLDDLLGGGMDRGTSNLMVGPAGAGKSTLATQYAVTSAQRGEKVSILIFDENYFTLRKRAEALGMALQQYVDNGMIRIDHVDAAEASPGELANRLRESVERDGVRMVIIDSLNGLLQAMPEEKFLTLQLHELLTFLSQKGVVSILVMAQHGLLGEIENPADLTYLADTVIQLRLFEASGAIRKAISVIKKRSGPHEDTIREMAIRDSRLVIGPVLREFHGVMTGKPVYTGLAGSLQGK